MEVVRTVGSVMGCIKKVVDLIDTSTKRGVDLATGLDFVKEDLDVIKSRLVEEEELHRQPLLQLKLQELAYDIDDFMHDLWTPGPFGGIVLSATGSDPRLVDVSRINYFKARTKTLFDDLDKQSQSSKSHHRSTPAVCSSSAGSFCAPKKDLGSSSTGCSSSASELDLCSSSAGSPSYAPERDLVGIAKSKEAIDELLSRGDGSLRVISISGYSGIGKTALARALYQDEGVANKFDYKAWVVPSNNSSAGILNKIHLEPARWSTAEASRRLSNKILQVLHVEPPSSPHFQKNKRYLVFVDDVQRGTAFKDIKDAFRENVMDSRIVITTRVPSIPWECSSGSYVYIMQGLDKEKSRELFRRKFREEVGYSEEDKYRLGNDDIDIIIDKCDGFPVALISAAKILHGKGQNPTTENFQQVSRELGDSLVCSEADFERYRRRNGNETPYVEMRRALVEPYENLLNNGEKDCLLYVSIFPGGYQINSKSLVRILIAEGLGPGDPLIMEDSEIVVGDIRDCLWMLMDQRMIEPVPIRSNCNAAKRCRVHSIMLQFTIKKAVSKNLVTLIHEGKPQYSTAGRVRRLTIQPSSDARISGHAEKLDLSGLRSLAIFKTGILNFEKCKLVRVLNLEGCHGITPKVLRNICRLMFLKYLSLRKTDTREIPREVKNLRCLETLDARETVLIKLPVEVIMLPRLVYLFGQFELTNVNKHTKKLNKFFKGNKSQLHSLGGISVDVTQGLGILLLVIEHATELKKIKVWYRNTPSSNHKFDVLRTKLNVIGLSRRMNLTARPSANPSSNTLAPAPATYTPLASDTPELIYCVSKLAETLKNHSITLESVYIDFNGVSNNFLDFIRISHTISSIKLRKGLGSLPSPTHLGKVCNLKKLHLFSTGLESKELAALQHLKCLQYLKLGEHCHALWDSVFHLKVGGFISLLWLCFESSNSKPPPLKIDQGVNTPLASLQLLCKETHPRVEGLSHLAKLNEVILDPSATIKEMELWKAEASKHTNRPYVEKKQD